MRTIGFAVLVLLVGCAQPQPVPDKPATDTSATEPAKTEGTETATATTETAATTETTTEATTPEAASDAGTAEATADTATAEAKTEVATETKTEVATADTTKTETARTEPKKTEPAKTEPKKTEPKKTEPKKTEPAKTETAKTGGKYTLVAVAAPDKKTERTWKSKCASCHGKDGKADTEKGKKMKVEDLTAASWQTAHSNAELKKAITDGLKQTRGGVKQEMDGFGSDLSADQVAALVQYVRWLGAPK